MVIYGYNMVIINYLNIWENLTKNYCGHILLINHKKERQTTKSEMDVFLALLAKGGLFKKASQAAYVYVCV